MTTESTNYGEDDENDEVARARKALKDRMKKQNSSGSKSNKNKTPTATEDPVEEK